MPQDSESKNGNGAWKNIVIAVLMSITLTSGAAWFGFGSNTVRKDELNELNETVRDLQRSVNQLTTSVAVLTVRLSPNGAQ